MNVQVTFPKKLKVLNEPHRYKVLFGGRGGSKSWGCARALLVQGSERTLRILCAREFQNSIRDSVHQLLSDQISALRLDEFYTIQNTQIIGQNGTTFNFEGLKHNATKIKSYEGADIAWVEEANTVSKKSWDILIPTIRKEGSEIWLTFNPDLEEDETYQRFVMSPPKESVVVKMNYSDNKWFPQVLEKERLEMMERDPIAYKNIWEGECRQAVEGAIFSKELSKAAEEGRITNVPYDPSVPVCTYWDLGRAALTAIWFVQYVGMQWRVLRHYSNHMEDLTHYLKYVQTLPYIYERHFLPHDGEQKRIGMALTVTEQAQKVLKNVTTVPRVHRKADAINAARQIFPLCWFDKELCADGLSDLRHYAYKITEDGRISSEPEETNFYRDTCDAFMTFAQARIIPKPLHDELDEMVRKQKRARAIGQSGVNSAWWK